MSDLPIIAAAEGEPREPMRVAAHPVDPAECPNPGCGGYGRRERRITVGGRTPYRCPDCHELWVDASETPEPLKAALIVAPPPGADEREGTA